MLTFLITSHFSTEKYWALNTAYIYLWISAYVTTSFIRATTCSSIWIVSVLFTQNFHYLLQRVNKIKMALIWLRSTLVGKSDLMVYLFNHIFFWHLEIHLTGNNYTKSHWKYSSHFNVKGVKHFVNEKSHWHFLMLIRDLYLLIYIFQCHVHSFNKHACPLTDNCVSDEWIILTQFRFGFENSHKCDVIIKFFSIQWVRLLIFIRYQIMC